jgi:NAD(P) transhydrogenase subunit beta
VNYFLEITYLVASVLFIFGLKQMSHPKTARIGMNLAAFGMLAAVVGTLWHRDIVSYQWILLGLVIGSIIGAAISLRIPMTAMPQRTALSHAFGALAATLVGIAEYYQHQHSAPLSSFTMSALGFEVLFGGITVTGSLMAFAKFQGLVRGTPVTYRGQNVVNLALFAAAFGIFVYLAIFPATAPLFYIMVGMALLFGVLLVIPIGAADMPVVMSLMNSYAGLASAATGFVLDNKVLIIAGTLDGFSGFILSILMCRAMNRSIWNVLFGAFGAVGTSTTEVEGEMVEITAEDAAMQLAYARHVVFVPGYGMATAQAQYTVRELAEALQHRGVSVKYAIHPVAGRMPGHMNVLLAEANVPYSSLYEIEQVNPEMPITDVAVVVGANDTVNPDARDNPNSPIAGMPIIEVDRAKAVFVLKRGKGKGFSGIENPLFFKENTRMLYGDAKASLTKLVQAVSQA